MIRRSDTGGKPRWRKLGGGSFRLNNRVIKPNQVFRASPEDIPEAFRDVVVCLDDLPADELEHAIEQTAEAFSGGYQIRARGVGGWCDIVDAQGKIVNEQALRREDAENLLRELN